MHKSHKYDDLLYIIQRTHVIYPLRKQPKIEWCKSNFNNKFALSITDISALSNVRMVK